MRPHGSPFPLPLFDDLGVGLLDEARSRASISPPVVQLPDPRVYQLRWGPGILRSALFTTSLSYHRSRYSVPEVKVTSADAPLSRRPAAPRARALARGRRMQSSRSSAGSARSSSTRSLWPASATTSCCTRGRRLRTRLVRRATSAARSSRRTTRTLVGAGDEFAVPHSLERRAQKVLADNATSRSACSHGSARDRCLHSTSSARRSDEGLVRGAHERRPRGARGVRENG